MNVLLNNLFHESKYLELHQLNDVKYPEFAVFKAVSTIPFRAPYPDINNL